MKYKILIVDDEEPARDLPVNYAQKIEGLEIAGVLSNALDAKLPVKKRNHAPPTIPKPPSMPGLWPHLHKHLHRHLNWQ